MERELKYKHEVTGVTRQELEAALGELATVRNTDIKTVEIERPALGYFTREDFLVASGGNSILVTRLMNRLGDISKNHPVARRLNLFDHEGRADGDVLDLVHSFGYLKRWRQVGKGIVEVVEETLDQRRQELAEANGNLVAAEGVDGVFAGGLERRGDTKDYSRTD